jgi:hypothetical protein
VKKILGYIYDFLAANDFSTVIAAFNKLDLSDIAKSVYTYMIILPILGFLLWTKRIKTIVALVSLFLFLLLIRNTISSTSETLSLHDLVTFLGGAVALIGVNLYFIFIRQ